MTVADAPASSSQQQKQLTADQINRYKRHLILPEVGTIGLVDIDVVSPSNLQRQVLFGVSNVGEDKVKAAQKRLKDLNPDCNVITHKTIVNSSNVMDLIKDYDVVI